MMTATVRDADCLGIRRGRDAVAALPGVSLASVRAQLGVGAFLRPLPIARSEVARFAMTILGLAMQVEPAWLDRPPRCETAFGEVPVLLIERCQALERLAANPEGRGGDDARLMQAALMLDEHLRVVEEAWEVKRRAVWEQMREAEEIASELLSMHLSSNLLIARAERQRYLYPERALPLTSSEDFRSLVRAIRVVAAARRNAQVDAVRTKERVVTAVTIAVTTIAFWDALLNRQTLLDRVAWQQIDWAAGLSRDAAQNTAEATVRYLTVLRREAERHPVLLVLDHQRLTQETVLGVGRAVDEALRDAEAAIARLRASGANTRAIPAQRRAQDLTPTGLAERLTASNRVSVWKLPFFVEDALLRMPPARASETQRVMELAARTGEGAAIAQSLSLFGINSAAMLAPAAGPVGVGLALAWALFSLGTTITEYRQLSDLFHATLDPAALLRGLDHEEASSLAILLDVIGLLVW